MEAGTKIYTLGFNLDGTQSKEAATVIRVTKEMLPMPDGYVPVRFDADRAVLLVHETQIELASA